MMDLILWRHAEAEQGEVDAEDLQRVLTPRGERQAARMGRWLDRQLPEGLRVLCSPAVRTEQTARALGRNVKLRAELAPGGTAQELLDCARWPHGRGAVLVVGHQPVIGQVLAELLGLSGGTCAVRKGAVWWLRQRERADGTETVLLTVQSPDLL
jgi:phosphohistidine phosphatase